MSDVQVTTLLVVSALIALCFALFVVIYRWWRILKLWSKVRRVMVGGGP